MGKRFSLVGQIDRAAVPIPLSIAAGYGRTTTQDCLHFLRLDGGVQIDGQGISHGGLGVGEMEPCHVFSGSRSVAFRN